MKKWLNLTFFLLFFSLSADAQTNPTFDGTVTFNQAVTQGTAIFPPTLLGSGIPSSLNVLWGDGTWRVPPSGGGGGSGTVTSVGLQVPSFLTVTPSVPITNSGVFRITYSGNPLPTSSGGVPAGGTSSQVLTKNSGTDFDYSWSSPGGGGGGPQYGVVTLGSAVTTVTITFGTPYTVKPSIVTGGVMMPSSTGAVIWASVDASSISTTGAILHLSGPTPDSSHKLEWQAYQ